MYKIDYHIHTVYSPDGKATPDEQISAAVSAGLSEIAFTDHCECNNNEAIPPDFERWFDFDPDSYIQAIKKTDKKGLKVKIGIELGQATQNKAFAESVLSGYEWDVVLGSLHNLRNNYDFYYLGLLGVDMRSLMKDYFEQLYELVCFDCFDVLAHLYYPVKYISETDKGFDIHVYNCEICDILKKLAENGKALEINTSALAGNYGNTVPDMEFLKMFRQLGGEFVTIGSDSHVCSSVGYGVSKTTEVLREIGYSAITTYEKRQPILREI